MITEPKRSLPHYVYTFIGRYPHRYKAILLDKKENHALRDYLTKKNFFQFYCTNNRHIVYEHQLLAFFYRGGNKMYMDGQTAPKGVLEVHHIDGNCFNNTPKNLVILTTEFHVAVTKLQRGVHKYLKLFSKKMMDPLKDQVMYNWRGRRVTDAVKWCVDIITMSCIRTYSHCLAEHICDPNVKLAPLTQFVSWLEKIVKRLKLGIDLTTNNLGWLILPDYYFDVDGHLVSSPRTS